MTSILEMRTNIVVKLATCLLLASALHMTFAAPPAVAAAAANRFHVDTRSSDDQNSRDLNLLASSSSSDEDLERRLQMHRLKVGQTKNKLANARFSHYIHFIVTFYEKYFDWLNWFIDLWIYLITIQQLTSSFNPLSNSCSYISRPSPHLTYHLNLNPHTHNRE